MQTTEQKEIQIIGNKELVREICFSNVLSQYDFTENKCFQCGKHGSDYKCDLNCDFISCLDDEYGNGYSINSTCLFCSSCFDKFEECGCGCGTKMCLNCADEDRCQLCNKPICDRMYTCRCNFK